MLWSKAIGAGGAGGGTTELNHTEFVQGSATFVVPAVGPSAGDLAIIHYTATQGEISPTPSGWAEISYTPSTPAFRHVQRVAYKVLTAADLGSTIVISTSTNSSLLVTYTKLRFVSFTPAAAITGVNISSLNIDVDTLPTRTKDTSLYDPPNMIFAAASFNNGVADSGFSETYWTQKYISGDGTQLVTAFEIQVDANTDRTVTPTFTGYPRICHSFVLNFA